MAPSKKHHAIDTASRERWGLLGRLLRARRIELGYLFRPAFADGRLPRTPQGNLQIRLLIAIENNERPGTFAPGRLEQFARAYEVTEESVYAVLRGESDQLVPAAAPPALPDPPPQAALLQPAADRAYATRIWQRLIGLAAAGNTAPSGAQVFGAGTPDAAAWDGTAGRMDLGDRVWLVAGLQRRDDGRGPGRSQAL